ncbi:DUF2726 domain-containing protein [Marinimicrobium sp. C2-29]|uniref:DUF2726 domain-containing protein n=1 Tax=Marinimicrobium sp. C2-29 TaxID=3139825 RepID=UPI00313891BE
MVEGILAPMFGVLKWVIYVAVVAVVAAVALKLIAGKTNGVRKNKIKRKGALRIVPSREEPNNLKPKKGTKTDRRNQFTYEPDELWPFIAKEVMTRTEKRIYRQLQSALPEFEIMAQVQLSQIIEVKKGHDFYKWFNRINRMSIDFVILNKELKALAAIEIDDCTHRDPKRMEADAKKNKALRSAGLTILRWEPNKMPSNEVIAQYFTSKSKKLPTDLGK